MDRKKTGSRILTGSILIAIFVILWNGSTTIPVIWDTVTSVIGPIAGGIAIAFIISIPAAPVRRFLMRHIPEKPARILSAVISALIILIIAVFIIALIIPQFISACRILADQLSSFSSDRELWRTVDIESIPVINRILDKTDADTIVLSEEILAALGEMKQPVISFTIRTISDVVSGIALFCVSVVFAFYFMMNTELLRRDGERIFGRRMKPEHIRRIQRTVSVFSSSFSKFITAQAVEAVIIGSICFIGMLIFRLPHAGAVSAFTGLMSLIPIYGAVIGALAGAFIIAVSSPVEGLLFLIFIFILQQLEGDLIYPRVVGTSTGLAPVYVFTSVTLGGILFGLAGMVFAVPVVSALYILLSSEDESTSGSESDPEWNTALKE